MASKTDLNYTDNMASNKKPFLTDIRASLDSIETYINEDKDNSVQIANDAFGTGYAFNNDGTQNFATYSLFDKQTGVDNYTGGNIVIATTAAWTDVDASNASVTFTPDVYTGDFKATFQFNVKSLTTNATNEVEVRFRLTDGSETSTVISNIHHVTGVNATTNTIPVTLVHEFDSMTAVSKTIKLQYYIATLTATTLTVLANTNSPIAMQVEKI